jgi:hypothetical protein
MNDGITEEELTDLITRDIEQEIVDQLEQLMQEGEVKYSPRQGGWVLLE